MRNFLEKKRGQTMRIIIEMNAQKQPVHYYDGVLIAVMEDAVIIKEQNLGEVAINPDKITAVQMPQAPAVAPAAGDMELQPA